MGNEQLLNQKEPDPPPAIDRTDVSNDEELVSGLPTLKETPNRAILSHGTSFRTQKDAELTRRG